jgi:DNA-binding response OmpR family regulator
MSTLAETLDRRTDVEFDVVLALDDCALARALRERLPQIDLRECDPVERAVDATTSSTDLLVLRLRGYDALEPLRRLRAQSRVRVLALVDPTVDGVDALDAGADDFVRLPCTPREIAARIASALRRRRWAADHRVMRFGDLTIDPVAQEARVRGRSVALPPLQFDLLAHLAAAPRRVFSRDELLEAVWRASPEWLGPATVTEHVRRLRVRLEAAGAQPGCIVTVRRRGYRFDPDRT